MQTNSNLLIHLITIFNLYTPDFGIKPAAIQNMPPISRYRHNGFLRPNLQSQQNILVTENPQIRMTEIHCSTIKHHVSEGYSSNAHFNLLNINILTSE